MLVRIVMRIVFLFIARIVVGITFLFSGFVKLVDPMGSAYKLEEYFGAEVLNLEFLIPYALNFSIVLILLEVLLGFKILLGYKSTITLWSLFVLTLLFLFLTWYAAYFDKVTDCGCFGDAVKLTAWETFYKNVVLLVLVVCMLFNRYRIKPIIWEPFLTGLVVIFFLVSSYVVYHVLVHLPLIDFRPYAVGKDIRAGMEHPAEGDALPPVHDFFLESDTADLTAQILSSPQAMLIIAPDIEKSNTKGLSALIEVAEKAINKGYLVYGISASTTAAIKQVKDNLVLPFDFLFCDETTLKTIIRANPGVLILEKGVVSGKWNWRDIDQIFEHKHPS